MLPATDVGTHVNLTGHPSTSSAEDQMDGAVAGAINTLLIGDVGEQIIPQSLPLHTTELGADLSYRIRSKIWANKYVDFFELINKVQPRQMTVSTGYSHQIISVMPQSKGRQISTIDQWTSAFLVFGAVYTQRFPEVAPGMFKYCEVVRDIAQTGPPFAWRQYDEQFRSFRQSNPTNFPWDQHRWGLFFGCMYTRQIQVGMGHAPATIPNKPTRHSQPMPLQACVLKVRSPPSCQFLSST